MNFIHYFTMYSFIAPLLSVLTLPFLISICNRVSNRITESYNYRKCLYGLLLELLFLLSCIALILIVLKNFFGQNFVFYNILLFYVIDLSYLWYLREKKFSKQTRRINLYKICWQCCKLLVKPTLYWTEIQVITF